MEDQHYILTLSVHRVTELYHVEVTHRAPNSAAQVASVRGTAAIDLDALLLLELRADVYGRALSEQLFANEAVAERFNQVVGAVRASGTSLRLLVSIDASAQELQTLRWELLTAPGTAVALSDSGRVFLSRLVSSRDWRPVRLRARTKPRALVAIAAPLPARLAPMKLVPVDYDAELERAKAALAGLELRVLGGPDAFCTLERLVEEMREGADIVYLVAHGLFGRSTGTPALVLQDSGCEPRPVKLEDLCARVAELPRGPRLIVLTPCADPAAPEPGTRSSAHSYIGSRLAEVGVPGVIAMQAALPPATAASMLPTLFKQLQRDGQADRALAEARAQASTLERAWSPALYTRLSQGCLWYTPGFRADKAEEVWHRLIKPVANGKIVPIIGPRLLEAAHGDAHSTAMQLADAAHYPLSKHDIDDLPRVTEYMRVKESRYNVIRAYQGQLLTDLIAHHRSWLPPSEIPPQNKKPRLGKLLALVGDRLRQNENDPYRILAELPASIYVTTNFDPLLERALKANGREPQQLLTRWRYKKDALVSDAQETRESSSREPLVYHAFGAFGPDNNDGLVLTEDDYFDYLIQTSAAKLMPTEVESALVDNSLLFLGFRLTDWHFRVLFRLMMSLPGRERLKRYCHVAVQLDPDMQAMSDVEAAKDYLSEYFGQEANIDIYWGNAEEFLSALRAELNSAGELEVEEEPEAKEEGGDDEWNF